MLPAAHRLTSGPAIRTAVRRGARASSGCVTVHLYSSPESGSPRAAFVVGRSVGSSVVRHRVQRRLRHVVAPLIGDLPLGSDLVVRAQPAAASASSQQLASDLDRALRRAARR